MEVEERRLPGQLQRLLDNYLSDRKIGRCLSALPSVRRSLQKEIKIAKDRAWSELVETVETDPWGKPYRAVTRKFPAKDPLVTTEMEPALQIVGTFFPPQEDSAAEQSRESI